MKNTFGLSDLRQLIERLKAINGADDAWVTVAAGGAGSVFVSLHVRAGDRRLKKVVAFSRAEVATLPDEGVMAGVKIDRAVEELERVAWEQTAPAETQP